jgi:predicted kinase
LATLFLMCGLPGAGKTTLAQALEERHSAVRLTADEWMLDLYPDESRPAIDRRRNGVERLQWRLAERLLGIGCNVVVDWGLWTREEREIYRKRARRLGAGVVLAVVEAPLNELVNRTNARQLESVSQLAISEREIQEWSLEFEHPAPEEMALYDSPPG